MLNFDLSNRFQSEKDRKKTKEKKKKKKKRSKVILYQRHDLEVI